ncbi:alpha/beta fold hydrolase (plasmid) [Cetobacterium somerae]|jgi:alpha-beta hydrolase superfamily lysophospholipase|uniref:alpha/beta fold hydrolase n=1 Tax=Cetobacterium somerae TaxID=188913 RepID=UPI003D769C5E
MSEYSNRYLEFTNFLNKNRYVVVLSDHRGHGEKALLNGTLGNFTGSFDTLVFDQVNISKEIKELFPNLPIFILGHSMGSFIAQKHMKVYSKEKFSYIFMGSCYERKLMTLIGKVLFKSISLLTSNPKKIFNDILFLGTNSRIKEEGKNSSSWLSRDPEVVKDFLQDPHCGFSYTPKFYYNFLDFLSKLYKKDSFNFVNKKTPILIISGEEDPIGLYGIGVKSLYNFYKTLEFKNISIILYKDCRHEILNELNKKNVYKDILKWLNEKGRV